MRSTPLTRADHPPERGIDSGDRAGAFRAAIYSGRSRADPSAARGAFGCGRKDFSSDYIAGVLETAGIRIVWSTKADTEGQYEEEFQDLLHFATLEDAEMCIMRLDELCRKFKEENERAAVERVVGGAHGPPSRGNDFQESQGGT